MPNLTDFQADYITVVEDRPIMSVKYCLPVQVFYFWRKLLRTLQRGLSAIAEHLVNLRHGPDRRTDGSQHRLMPPTPSVAGSIITKVEISATLPPEAAHPASRCRLSPGGGPRRRMVHWRIKFRQNLAMRGRVIDDVTHFLGPFLRGEFIAPFSQRLVTQL